MRDMTVPQMRSAKPRNYDETEAIRMLSKLADSPRLTIAQRNACLEARNRLHALWKAANRYAVRYMVDESEEDGPEVTGCSREQSEDARNVFKALVDCAEYYP